VSDDAGCPVCAGYPYTRIRAIKQKLEVIERELSEARASLEASRLRNRGLVADVESLRAALGAAQTLISSQPAANDQHSEYWRPCQAPIFGVGSVVDPAQAAKYTIGAHLAAIARYADAPPPPANLPRRFGRSLSWRAAHARMAGRRWGCLLCRFLDWAVERGHCDLVLTERPTAWVAIARSAGWYAALTATLAAACRVIWGLA
jgi:hypothetical protein